MSAAYEKSRCHAVKRSRSGNKFCVCPLPLRHRLPHRCFGIGCRKRWGFKRRAAK